MASPALTACVCVLLLPTVRGLRSRDREDRLCAFSNYPHRGESASPNGMPRGVKENGTIHCSHGSSCYGLWEKRADGEMLLLKQGCWTFVGNQQECHDDGCFLATAISSQMQKTNYHFCCCNQDLCNTNYAKAPPTTTSPDLKPIKRDNGNQTDQQFTSKESTLITVGTVATATIVLVALLLGYRVMKRNQKNHPSAAGLMEAANHEATMEVDGLKLLDVENNLRELSDDYLTEFIPFDSQLPATNCERLQSTEVTSLGTTMKSQQGSTGPRDGCLFSTIHPHQTLPQRPTSLHLPPNKRSTTASSRPKLGKLKFLHEQVETGVATMNTVSEVSVGAEPRLVTMVTNNAIMRSSSANRKGGNLVCRSTGESVPTLGGNSVIGRGRINPAGPQDKEEEEEEEEVKLEIGMQGEESHPILLNCGPEEHEPLLRSEQLPAESELHPLPQNQAGNISTGLAPNSNNNNNRPASLIDPRGRVGVLTAESELAAQTLTGYPASVSQREREVLCSGLKSQVFYNGTLTVQVPLTMSTEADGSGKGPHQKTAEKGSALDFTRRDQLLKSAVVIRSRDPKNQLGVSEKALEKNVPAALKAQLPQEEDPASKASHPDAQTPSSLKPPVLEDPSTYREASPLTPETVISKVSLDKGSKLQHEDLPIPTGEPKAPDLMQFQVQHTKARGRPCSLELSSSCSSSDYVSVSSDGSLSATGEKIKQRVKTPYTLKKWCTASWVVSAETSPSSDSECNTSASGSCQDASGVRRGCVGIHMNPFQSSTTAFVVGGGDITTKTSEQEESFLSHF